MRQAEDSKFAEVIAQICIQEPRNTILNMGIGAPIPDSPAAPIIVHRYYVWHTINFQKLQETALAHGMPFIYCKAEVVASNGLSSLTLLYYSRP